MQELERVQRLGDHALIEELIRSAKHDRLLTVRMLAELGEVHARGLGRAVQAAQTDEMQPTRTSNRTTGTRTIPKTKPLRLQVQAAPTRSEQARRAH